MLVTSMERNDQGAKRVVRPERIRVAFTCHGRRYVLGGWREGPDAWSERWIVVLLDDGRLYRTEFRAVAQLVGALPRAMRERMERTHQGVVANVEAVKFVWDERPLQLGYVPEGEDEVEHAVGVIVADHHAPRLLRRLGAVPRRRRSRSAMVRNGQGTDSVWRRREGIRDVAVVCRGGARKDDEE